MHDKDTLEANGCILHIGETFGMGVPENKSTGEIWTYVSDAPKVFTVEEMYREDPNPDHEEGKGGTLYYGFKAIGTGTGNFYADNNYDEECFDFDITVVA